MKDNVKILILGAGYAGIHIAKKLNRKYKKNDSVQITIIDRNPFHTLMTELHEVAGGRVPEDSVKISLSKIFYRTKVNVITDYIENVDTDKMCVKTSNGIYNYDYLVISTGAEPAFFGVENIKENGFTLWSLEDALKIRNHIDNMFKNASKESDINTRKGMLNFVVAGSGFTGVEMAGELIEWKHQLAKKYNINKNEINLTLVEAMPTILNLFDRKQAKKAENYMIKNGIKIFKNSPITRVYKDHIELKNGNVIETNTLIWTCGIKAKEEASNYGLETNKAGRLCTNSHMQVIGKENVYAAGDVGFYEINGKGTPQIVETSLQTGDTISKNIISQIENRELSQFNPKYHGFMVSIGGKYCVANLSGIKLSGFFAMLMKHLVNLHYLWGVNGINACYHYLIHEFFSIKDKRSITRGFLSSKSNRLWLIPLRLFIGCSWLLEGLHKFIGENTWASKGFSSLSSGIGSDSWMKSGNINLPFGWLKNSATSSASQDPSNTASTAAAQVQPILKHVPDFYNSLMKLFIPNPDVAIWFQRFVVISEILIGLAIIAGLFTFLASAASAFLVINFILSSMAGWDILWYFFGAIALMGGAGRTFGLDYFVIPWIRDKLSKWWLGVN